MINTLGNTEWLKANEDKVKALFPEVWTHQSNLNLLQLGFQMKLLGIDWRSQSDLAGCMAFFERTGFLLREGLTVKRNPRSLFA